MQKRMSINPQMVKQYSNDVRLREQSDIVNEGSESDSDKNLKPTDSTKIKQK